MLSFNTSKPNALLTAIKAEIDKGHITTWRYDNDGDFTHVPAQWAGKAWMRPQVVNGEALKFNIIYPRGKIADREIYAVYHGRFSEMMLAHFDSVFTRITATALLASGDQAAAA